MEKDPFKPHPLPPFGIKHEPLLVTAVASNKRDGQVVAFLEKQLCFFEHDGYIPQIGETLEVMISRPLFPYYSQKDVDEMASRDEKFIPPVGAINRRRLMAVLIRPVEPDKHQLMAIDGFECSGSMCRTMTSATITDGSGPIEREVAWKRDKFPISLTPGRCGITVANNTNAGSTWKVPYLPRVSTNVYVDKALMEEKKTLFFISGMTRIEDCEYSNLFKR